MTYNVSSETLNSTIPYHTNGNNGYTTLTAGFHKHSAHKVHAQESQDG